jgi:hypothetical protein
VTECIEGRLDLINKDERQVLLRSEPQSTFETIKAAQFALGIELSMKRVVLVQQATYVKWLCVSKAHHIQIELQRSSFKHDPDDE